MKFENTGKLYYTERLGFEPRDPVSQVNSLAVSCFRPLSHLSKLYNFNNILSLVKYRFNGLLGCLGGNSQPISNHRCYMLAGG